MESTIEVIKERIEKIPGSNLGDKLKEHFENESLIISVHLKNNPNPFH